MSAVFLGTIYSLDNLLAAALLAGGGQLADRLDARKLFIGVIALAGFAALTQLFTHSLITFLIPLFIFSGLFSISSPILEKIESETVRRDATGFDFALISFSVSIGTVAGSMGIGQLMNSFGERVGFITLAIGYFVMALIARIGLRPSLGEAQQIDSTSRAECV